jgi:hypothetical protein
MSIDDVKKRGRGRPPVDTAPVTVRLSADVLAAIDKYRGSIEGEPTRPEAIRLILTDSLLRGGFLKRAK